MIISNRICIEEGCNELGLFRNMRVRGGARRYARCGVHKSRAAMKASGHYTTLRKDYCENIDGRLGFKCQVIIMDKFIQLDADHINNDHSDSRPENIQTLCKMCHPMKTNKQTKIKRNKLEIVVALLDKLKYNDPIELLKQLAKESKL